MNLTGFYTLFKKEILRFWKVAAQTITAPILTAVLYQVVFSHVMKGRGDILPGINYSTFLIPGLAMMSILQNAFANTSSSLIQSRISGNIVFILLPPISNTAFFCAYIGAATARGLLIGSGVILSICWFGLPSPHNIVWIIIFAVSACIIMGSLGLLAGIVSEKFEQLSMFQNFLIMPLIFLSGIFYSINNLPVFWKQLSHVNPFFYMIDGFRFGFFGVSDVSPWLSLIVVLFCIIMLVSFILYLLSTGYKLRK